MFTNTFKYKFYLAIKSNKLIAIKNLFLISYDIREEKYKIWYITDKDKLVLYETIDNIALARFKWNILIVGGAECLY